MAIQAILYDQFNQKFAMAGNIPLAAIIDPRNPTAADLAETYAIMPSSVRSRAVGTFLDAAGNTINQVQIQTILRQAVGDGRLPWEGIMSVPGQLAALRLIGCAEGAPVLHQNNSRHGFTPDNLAHIKLRLNATKQAFEKSFGAVITARQQAVVQAQAHNLVNNAMAGAYLAGQQQQQQQQAVVPPIVAIARADVIDWLQNIAVPDDILAVYGACFIDGQIFVDGMGFLCALYDIPDGTILFTMACTDVQQEADRLGDIHDLMPSGNSRIPTKKQRKEENEHWFSSWDGSNSYFRLQSSSQAFRFWCPATQEELDDSNAHRNVRLHHTINVNAAGSHYDHVIIVQASRAITANEALCGPVPDDGFTTPGNIDGRRGVNVHTH